MKGPSLLEWIPEFHFDGPLPSRSVPRGRSYSSVVFDPSTTMVVAASSLQARFASFDEDSNRLWEPDGKFKRIASCWSILLTIVRHATLVPNVSDPVCDCSTLELTDPDLWMVMDGYVPRISSYGISPDLFLLHLDLSLRPTSSSMTWRSSPLKRRVPRQGARTLSLSGPPSTEGRI